MYIHYWNKKKKNYNKQQENLMHGCIIVNGKCKERSNVMDKEKRQKAR
jgi:hypothetical protein